MLNFKHLYSDLGFNSVKEFLMASLGLKGLNFVILQISIAGIAGFLAFMEKWIYYPSSSIFIMVGLIFSDCLLNLIQSRKEHKKWDRSQLNRFVPLLLTRLFLMSMGFHLKQADPDTFGWIPETIFAYFSAQHALSILESLVDLKLVNPRVLNVIGSRLLGPFPKKSSQPKKENPDA